MGYTRSGKNYSRYGGIARIAPALRLARNLGKRLATRFKGKGGGSRTKTRTQRRSRASPGSGPIGAGRVSFLKIKNKERGYKGWRKGLNPLTYVSTESGRVADVVGTQATGSLYPVLQADLVRVLYTVSGIGAIATGYNNYKLFMQHVSGTYRFTNQSKATCEMVLYDCKMTAAGRAGLTAGLVTQTMDPVATWREGVDELIGGTNTSIGIVGTLPSDTALFNRRWNVLKKMRIVLGPGDTHEHKINYTVNRFLSYDPEYQEQEPNMIRPFIVVTGFPDNDSTTKTQVSTASTAIDYVFSARFKYYLATTTAPARFDYGNNLVASYTVGESLMEEDGDVVAGGSA